MRTGKDLTGQKFGRLVVVGRAPDGTDYNQRWHCVCECGANRIVFRHSLTTGVTQSCGCLHRERMTRHGMFGKPEYSAWVQMLQRCTNPKKKCFQDYGGRGITVCERWRAFENFYADMGPRPSPTHSLDRSDNDGNYEPENCRWATNLEQTNNRRVSRHLTLDGRTQTVGEWAREFNISRGVVYRRLDRGWDARRALTTEVRHMTRGK
jgi:hypothetical protein